MSLRLILTRHAKSSWDTPQQDDHDRPLNKRGRQSAGQVGAWLNKNGYVPDQVLSSSATRTAQTWKLMKGEAGWPAVAEFQPLLYLAGPDEILRQLRQATGQCVMLLGHNPGIGYFASWMVETPARHSRFSDYPTCATSIIDFDCAGWNQVEPGIGSLTGFITPHDLPQSTSRKG